MDKDTDSAPEQRFYDDLVQCVDSATYFGIDPQRCLIGQYAKYKNVEYKTDFCSEETLTPIAEVSGVDVSLIREIFSASCAEKVNKNLPLALDMAKRILGLS